MSVENEISKINATLSNAFASGDAAAIINLYTDDAWFMVPHVEALKGKSAIQVAFQGLFDGGITGISLSTTELDILGDTVIEAGEFSLSAGDVIADQGKFMVVWKNINGKWLIHRDIINSDLPATASA